MRTRLFGDPNNRKVRLKNFSAIFWIACWVEKYSKETHLSEVRYNETMEDHLVVALYKFEALPDYQELRQPLLDVCRARKVFGTLLLAAEGINGTIAGVDEDVHAVVDFLRKNPRLSDLRIKESRANKAPFHRMKVRLKKEIVTMGMADLDPMKAAGTYVDPAEWNELIQDKDVWLVDTRNDYEVAIGSFPGATNPKIKNFREFPEWFRNQNSRNKKKIAMFCTGGIRCEKSTAFLRQEGWEEVFHLRGGVLKYLEWVPQEESLWQGECFVFDERVAVQHGLKEGTHSLCRACRYPLSQEDRQSPHHVEGVSCPHCWDQSTAEQKAGFVERQKQMKLAKARGASHLAEG